MACQFHPVSDLAEGGLDAMTPAAMTFCKLVGMVARCVLVGGTSTAVPRAVWLAANARPLNPLSASRSRGGGPASSRSVATSRSLTAAGTMLQARTTLEFRDGLRQPPVCRGGIYTSRRHADINPHNAPQAQVRPEGGHQAPERPAGSTIWASCEPHKNPTSQLIRGMVVPRSASCAALNSRRWLPGGTLILLGPTPAPG
jgi:hypothetical protein